MTTTARIFCALAFLLAPGLARTAGASGPVTIYACVNNNGANQGQVRVVAPTEACTRNETRISWPASLAGLSCPNGQFVTGFDNAGLLVCAAPSGGGGGGGGGTSDADQDGIPDALDACPSSPNLFYNGGSFCPASLYDVTLQVLPAGASVFMLNLHVDSAAGSSIVVSVQPGDAGYNGAAGSSLSVDLGSIPVPAVGSRVNLIGVVLSGGGFSVVNLIVTVGP